MRETLFLDRWLCLPSSRVELREDPEYDNGEEDDDDDDDEQPADDEDEEEGDGYSE